MKIAVSNPSVAPHVRQTVTAYYEAGHLQQFYTTLFEHPENYFSSQLKQIKAIRENIGRRSFHEIPIEKFCSRPLPELVRTISSKKLGPRITDRIWEWAELSFDTWVSRKVSHELDAVHTYEHAALATLSEAKAKNVFCIYEQPSVHHTFFSSLVSQQLSLYPELLNSE
ncbi:MAG: hypothetical protein V4577_30355, partial [Bacteroidota bacterium]